MLSAAPLPPISPQMIPQMNHAELQVLAAALLEQLGRKDAEIHSVQQLMVAKDQELNWRQSRIDQLTHEIAVLRRLKFAATSERLARAGGPEQASLWGADLDADLAAIEAELDALRELASDTPTASTQPERPRSTPKRAALPPELPRTVVNHEPVSTTCGCGTELQRVGEEVSEKLDYTPGVFTVQRHVRGKWACRCCQTLVQAPVPAHVIDKGIPTAALLADVLVGKYADHLPLYRQEDIYARAGVAIPRSTLSAWVGRCGVALQPLADALAGVIKACGVVHADETPVQMLSPGEGKTHRSYLWAYASGQYEPVKAVVYDFCTSRGGQHVKAFLGDWRGTLVCDDYSAYKALFTQGVTEAGCMAHARRKFFELHAASQSPLAASALEFIGRLYEVERLLKEVSPEERLRVRQGTSRSIMDAWREWMVLQRTKLTANSATARAMDYSLKRWQGLSRFLHDGAVPIDNNHIENLIRPITLGRNNWLFAGSERAGKRAAAVQSLIQSARLNGLDPYVYLKDVLERLPTHKASAIEALLPHKWQPLATG
jgi:transposase